MTEIKISLSQWDPTVGDIQANSTRIKDFYLEAAHVNSDILVFPEMFLSGYPTEDLTVRPAFMEDIHKAIDDLISFTLNNHGPAIIFGSPWRDKDGIFNAAIVIDQGKLIGVSKKYDLPNYGVFDEKRIFNTPPTPGPINIRGIRVGILICEDLWGDEVVECLEETGAEILITINGSPFEKNKHNLRMNIGVAKVKESQLPLIYLNLVGGQDELVFDGNSFILNTDLTLAAQLPMFEEKFIHTTWHSHGQSLKCQQNEISPSISEEEQKYLACVRGLRDYVIKSGFKGHVLLGLSGGIDSALVAIMAVDAFGAQNVDAYLLPYHYTSKESIEDAKTMADNLGISSEILPIEPAIEGVSEVLAGLFKDVKPDITEENIQSRTRGLILMALSNKFGGLLLTTGNKSEVAVGYATLYGDMNGGFNPIKDLYKTEVYELARWRNENCPEKLLGKSGEVIPQNIISKEPSAELKEGQVDQDSLPPYEVLDDILYNLIEEKKSIKEIVELGYPLELVRRIEHLVYISEYKRRQSAPGVKLSKMNFGNDRRYPIMNLWRDRL